MLSLYNLLFEAKKKESKKTIKLPKEEEISDSEKSEAYNKLSETEKNQLGTENYLPYKDWPRFRKYMVQKSSLSNPGLDPDLTAYTPGETLKLLDHPTISSWLKNISDHIVPIKYDTVVFVPCAKTKPWEACEAGIYGSYNRLRNEYGNLYFVTISEPLGIVPQDMWGEFPQYDNPGLFKNAAQRSDMFTSDWKRLFGVESYLQTPFDKSAYKEAINRLSNTIKKFIETNRKERPELNFLSFVEDSEFKIDKKNVGSHSDMLTTANVLDPKDRYTKRSGPRQEPYQHIKDILTKREIVKNVK